MFNGKEWLAKYLGGTPQASSVFTNKVSPQLQAKAQASYQSPVNSFVSQLNNNMSNNAHNYLSNRAYAPAASDENQQPLLQRPVQQAADVNNAINQYHFTPEGQKMLRNAQILYPGTDPTDSNAYYSVDPNTGRKYIVLGSGGRVGTPQGAKQSKAFFGSSANQNSSAASSLTHEWLHSIDNGSSYSALQNAFSQNPRLAQWGNSRRGGTETLPHESFSTIPTELGSTPNYWGVSIPPALRQFYTPYFQPGAVFDNSPQRLPLQPAIARGPIDYQSRLNNGRLQNFNSDSINQGLNNFSNMFSPTDLTTVPGLFPQ